ncbi:MAG: phage portal protein [Chloroflexi bacterium]|nr:phage portal protein [Chloroflexota bacterium]
MSDFSLAELDRRDSERMRNYKALLDFYQGIHWDGRERRGDKRLTFNYSKVFVEKVASYLMSGVSFAVDPVEDSDRGRAKAQAAETALHRIYETNNLEQLDFETEIDCAILGDACYKVIWDHERGDVRITAPDIQGIYAWRAGDDISRVWRVASRYRLSAEEAETLYTVKPKGDMGSVVEVWTDQHFELWLDDLLVEKKPNPYGFIPFIIYPNLREPKQFWGVSDLVPILEPQRELNRAVSQLAKILELSGNPIAVLENVEESEDIAVRPGAVWNIPEDAKAYLLDLLQGGGVRLHIDYINLLFRVLHDLSETPRASFGRTERDLSGIALEIELQPLMQKVKRKRLVRAAVYNERNRLAMKLLEKFHGDSFGNNRLRVVWGPVLPRDLAQLVANEQTLVQSGIHSRRRAMDEMGIKDPAAEFRLWLEEREAILRMNRELNLRASKGGTRGRDIESQVEAARNNLTEDEG